MAGMASNSRHQLSLLREIERERERKREFNLSIQPALAYEDMSLLESSAKVRMAAKQRQTAFWFRCHMNGCTAVCASSACARASARTGWPGDKAGCSTTFGVPVHRDARGVLLLFVLFLPLFL